MKCVFKSIIIERDPMTKIPKVVAPWEVPVYRSQYGDEKVEILDKDVEVEIEALPDTTEEYLRLRDVFGIEPDTKQSHVDIVYGRGAQAIKPLGDAIKGSIAGDIEKAQKVVDGTSKPDEKVVEARKHAYVDEREDEMLGYTMQKSEAGPKEARGIAAEILKAEEANTSKTTAEGNAVLAKAGRAAAEALAASTHGGKEPVGNVNSMDVTKDGATARNTVATKRDGSPLKDPK